jgi:hypothetical protein
MLVQMPTHLKMRDYPSKLEECPNEIIFRITSFKKIKTEYSLNVVIEIDGKHTPYYLPLRQFSSANTSLLELWNSNVRLKNFKKGSVVKLFTWKKGQRRNWKLGGVTTP